MNTRDKTRVRKDAAPSKTVADPRTKSKTIDRAVSNENPPVDSSIVPTPSTSSHEIESVSPPEISITTVGASKNSLMSQFLQYQRANEMRDKTARNTESVFNLLTVLQQTASVCNESKDAVKALEAANIILKVTESKVLTSIGDAHVIYANNEQKVIELLSKNASTAYPIESNIVNTYEDEDDESSLDQKAEYKFTFKLKSDLPHEMIVIPVDEVWSLMENCSFFAIIDEYQSAAGHVVKVNNRKSYNALKRRLEEGVTTKGSQFNDIFEIRDQIISSFSVKTDKIPRQYLKDIELVVTCDGYLNIDTTKMINTLLTYNRAHFKRAEDVDNVEVFGLNKADSQAHVTMKIHVSEAAFNRFLMAKKPTIMIKSKVFRVFEEISVIQCLNCCQFGHEAESNACSGKYNCRFCAQDNNPNGTNPHAPKDCPSKDSPVCINCTNKARLEGKNPDEGSSHSATSFACPLVKKELSRLRKEAKSKGHL